MGRSPPPASISLGEELADAVQRRRQPGYGGRPLGDPPPGRSVHRGVDYPTLNTSSSRTTSPRANTSRRGQRRHRHPPAVSSTSSASRRGFRRQGRHDRRADYHTRDRPDAVPALDPLGLGLTATRSPTATTRPPRLRCGHGQPDEDAPVWNPIPGVWEVTVDARRSSDADNAPYPVTVSLLGRDACLRIRTTSRPRRSGRRSRGRTRSRTCSGRSRAVPWARARERTLGPVDDREPRDSRRPTSWFPRARRRFGPRSAARRIRRRPRSVRAQRPERNDVLASQADGDSEESVTITNPAAGTWKVVVDGFAVPAGATRTSTSTSSAKSRRSDRRGHGRERPAARRPSWTVPGSVPATEVPPPAGCWSATSRCGRTPTSSSAAATSSCAASRRSSRTKRRGFPVNAGSPVALYGSTQWSAS